MGRMESSNLDETRPTPVHKGADDIEETRPTPVRPESGGGQETLDQGSAPGEIAQPAPASPEGHTEGEISPELENREGDMSDDTLPTPVTVESRGGEAGLPEATVEAKPKRRRRVWILWAILSILALALVAAGSAYLGYLEAIDERTSFEATQIAGEAKTQYDLGLEDIQAGRYELARQRFQYVIQLDPGYPGAIDRLAEVELELRTTATPTLEPTPTLTPTPDLRGRDELFIQAQSALLGGDWTQVIDTLLTLRKQYPDYRSIEVDGMLYVALRNRGVDKIVHGDLEGGNYDLSLTEGFGPLDSEAKNWRDWAEMYIRGAANWDVNWEQAVFYFSQLATIAPNLSDASGWMAHDRYVQALIGYGDWLARQGDWCLAVEQYQTALELTLDPQLEPTTIYAFDTCEQGEVTEEPGEGTPTPEGTPGEATPTPSPTTSP